MLFITIFTRSLPLDHDLIQFNSFYNLQFKIHLKGLHINEERANENITTCNKITELKALLK